MDLSGEIWGCRKTGDLGREEQKFVDCTNYLLVFTCLSVEKKREIRNGRESFHLQAFNYFITSFLKGSGGG